MKVYLPFFPRLFVFIRIEEVKRKKNSILYSDITSDINLKGEQRLRTDRGCKMQIQS